MQVTAAAEFPDDLAPTVVVRLPYAGCWYLGSAFSTWPAFHPHRWHEDLWDDPVWRHNDVRNLRTQESIGESVGCFVMEETACTGFLNSLTGMIRADGNGRLRQLDLPSFEPVGFGLGEGSRDRRVDGSEYNYALFRDGLALLDDPFRSRKVEIRIWSPKEGFKV